MTKVKLRGFQIFRDRYGVMRCYHRKTKLKIDLEKAPLGSAAFLAECERIASIEKRIDTVKAGTLGSLIKQYKTHAAFTDLAPRTRVDYERCFNYLKDIFPVPLTKFTTPLVVRIRDKIAEKHGRRSANYMKTVLSIVFAWGKERGLLRTNPALGIKGLKRPKDAGYANRPWKDHEREAVLSALPAHMRLPVLLMMFCGLDPQDALKMPKTAIADGKINTRRGKTGVSVWMPIPQPVTQEIERINAMESDSITLCLNSKKRPWTVSGFRASWRPIREKLENSGEIESGLTLKGLRHTVATILAELGYDERTIADVLGQKTTEMARHYSRSADKSKKVEAAVIRLGVAMNKKQK